MTKNKFFVETRKNIYYFFLILFHIYYFPKYFHFAFKCF